MRYRNLSLSFLVLGALACTSEEPANIPKADGGTAASRVTGKVFYILEGVREVVVHQADSLGVPKGELCRTQTTEAGAFECLLGPYSGLALIEVSLAKEGGRSLRSYVHFKEIGAAETAVVSIYTHWAAQYVTNGGRKQVSATKSLQEATRLIYGHFGAVDHAKVVPADLRAERPNYRMHPETAGVILEALAYLAEDYPSATLWDFVTVLSADIRTDGVWDGLGDRQLELAGKTIDGETLRSDLGRALLRWAETKQNRTPFTAEDLRPLAERIADNTSEIFPAKTGHIDQTPPMVLSFQVRKDGEDRSAGKPLSGVGCDVSVEALDSESGVAVIEAELVGLTGVLSEDRDGLKNWGRFDFDSRELPDGLHEVRMRVGDKKGNYTAFDSLHFVVDNSPPGVRIDARESVQVPALTLTITATDSSDIEKIQIVSSAETKVVEKPQEGRAMETIRLTCSGGAAVETVEITVTDAAENEAKVSHLVHCDTLAPRLTFAGQPYLDESHLEVSRTVSGPPAIAYEWRGGAPPQPEYTDVSAQPYLFKKYFTRLDSGSDNLPVLAWWVRENPGAQIEYRYLIDNTVMRDWTAAAEGGDAGYYPIEVSYQSLSPDLGRYPVSAIHRVEFRVQDRAGNTSEDFREFQVELLSPPVWVRQCELGTNVGELGNLSLSARNVHQMYRRAQRTTLGRGEVEYILGLSSNSLAPREGLSFGLVQSEFEGEITELRETAHYGPTYHGPGGINDPYFCAPRLGFNKCHSILERALAVPVPANAVSQGLLQTFDYPKDQETLFHDAQRHGRISDARAEEVLATLLIAGAPVNRLNSDRWEVNPGHLHSLQFSVDSPLLTIGGAQYGWGRNIVIPQAYVLSQVPEHYEMTDTNFFRSGVEIDATDIFNTTARQFVTRPYIAGLRWDVRIGRYEAESLAPHRAQIPIVVDSSCQSSFSHSTQL